MKETIELRELIEIILKGKWIISVITIICTLFAGFLSWFLLPEKYDSKAVIQVASSVQDTGIMESFIATEFTPQVYSQRLKNESIINEFFQHENMKNEFNPKNLNVNNEANTNLLTLTYTSNSPENAQKELQALMDATKNEMNFSVQNTLKNLEMTYGREAQSLSNEIETIINEYNTIVRENRLPEVLILQTVLNPEMVVNISDEQTKALANVSGAVQNQLLQLQAQIQTKSDEYRNVLSKYQSVKTGLEDFKADPFIRIIVEPNLPKAPTSPKILINLVIGFVFGIMLGFIITFFKHFWRYSVS